MNQDVATVTCECRGGGREDRGQEGREDGDGVRGSLWNRERMENNFHAAHFIHQTFGIQFFSKELLNRWESRLEAIEQEESTLVVRMGRARCGQHAVLFPDMRKQGQSPPAWEMCPFQPSALEERWCQPPPNLALGNNHSSSFCSLHERSKRTIHIASYTTINKKWLYMGSEIQCRNLRGQKAHPVVTSAEYGLNPNIAYGALSNSRITPEHRNRHSFWTPQSMDPQTKM